MIREVFFRTCDGYAEIAVTEDGDLEHFYRLTDGFLTGAIFRGKITRVVKQVGAFVDIGLDKDGLLSFRDGYKVGDFITVQVRKEPTETKGCALTEEITLPGRYLVLTDRKEHCFSHKLSASCKERLSCLTEQTADVGFVFRTACEEATTEEIEKERARLTSRYEEILSKAKNTYEIRCFLQDTAREIAFRTAAKDEELTEGFDRIEKQLIELDARKVEKEGVELVFDKTEAMTVVDINYHRYGKTFGDADRTAYRANLVAMEELARQIRLRNLGGIIVVDLIGFHDRTYFAPLRDALISFLKKDTVKTSVDTVESAGLFVIVRKIRYASI